MALINPADDPFAKLAQNLGELEVTPQLLGWETKKALRPTEAELLPPQDPKTASDLGVPI